jgi:hypothetical protein
MGAWGYKSDANDAVLDEVFPFYSDEYMKNYDKKLEVYKDLTPTQADEIFDKISDDTRYEALLRTGTIIHMLRLKPAIVSSKQVKHAIKKISEYLDANENTEGWGNFDKRKEALVEELKMLTGLTLTQ